MGNNKRGFTRNEQGYLVWNGKPLSVSLHALLGIDTDFANPLKFQAVDRRKLNHGYTADRPTEDEAFNNIEYRDWYQDKG